MPMPAPRSGESLEEFLGRCMSDDVMNAEHTGRDERFAVCNSLWERKTMGKFHKSYGDCEGPLGFPMRSCVARDLEATIKGLDGDCKGLVEAAGGLLHKAAAAKVEVDAAEQSDISVVTTDALDLDREVMLPDGLDWTPFKKNGGPVTFGHNYKLPTVGRCAWLVRSETPNGWKAKTLYHPRPGPEVLPKEAPWFPGVAFHYVKDLGMNGRSIGYVPLSAHKPTAAEISARPEVKGAKSIIAKAKVFEYAVTALPCNQESVVEMVSKAAKAGIVTPDLVLDAFGIIVPGMGEDEPPELEREEKIITVGELKALVAERLKTFDLGRVVAEVLDRRRGRV